LKIEAIALSRLGKVYDKILKMEDRAKEYYKKCVQVSLTSNALYELEGNSLNFTHTKRHI